MTGKRIRNILNKEWSVMFRDLNNALFVTLLPLLIVGQAILIIWLIVKFGSDDSMSISLLQNAVSKLTASIPSLAGLSSQEQLQMLLLSQFNFYLLLIPAMIAIGIATFSIVEEKITRSLEPLLATPVRTWELLLGKALSGAIPALIVTWICMGVFLVAVAGLGWGHLLNLLLNTSWYICLFLLTPLVAVLSFLLGVIASSRAADARSAQNIVIMVILPILALIGVQVAGVVWFTPLLNLALALIVGVVDIIVLRIAVRLFQRESIVVKWH
ncbi:MAG: ABC transporter permease subunit [Chloroflexota bacterium]|nr:ABC transporter permease subunit [Chloroflexota bacterium]